MSKSDPDSAIFMEDSVDDVQRKIKKAYYPEKQVHDNPCVAYVRLLVFPAEGRFHVRRSDEHGGDFIFDSPDDFEKAFLDGDVHPNDLKKNLADALNRMIEPVRRHFKTNAEAKQLLEKIQSYRVIKDMDSRPTE